jgi:hypothetical protein
MTLGGKHSSMFGLQYGSFRWHVVPPRHGADPSMSHCWAQVLSMMHTSPGEQVPASRPHFCPLAEQASPPARNAHLAATQNRLMGLIGETLSRLQRGRSAPDQAVK